MNLLKGLTLFSLAVISQLSFAHYDYSIYPDNKGMPRCIETTNKEKRVSIIFSWAEQSKDKSRPVFYRVFDSNPKNFNGAAAFGNVCSNWMKFDPVFLFLDSKMINFNNGKSPEYIEEFTMSEKMKRALEQLHSGMNKFLAPDAFVNKQSLKETFEPFKMSTYKNLMSDVGAQNTTNLYHGYIKTSGIGNDCSKYIGTCEYYLCREKNKQCGSEGYFLGFGYQYCSDSLKRLMKDVSPQGQKWLKTTATCLHQQLEEVGNNNSCAQLKKKAISSHDKCYSEVSFCSLSIVEMTKILEMIHPALLESGVMIEGVQVLGHCAGL